MKKNQSKLKKVLSLISATAMAIAMLPTAITSIFTSAEVTQTLNVKSISFGTSNIENYQRSKIFFGTYKQSSNTNGGYNTEPIQWKVLSSDDKLFLLSDKNIDVVQYNNTHSNTTYKNSTIRSWLNGYGSSYNTERTDYSNDNFIKTAFSSAEQASIARTDVINSTYDGTTGNPNPDYTTSGGSDTTDKIFLLSVSEAQNVLYNFDQYTTNSATRISSNTDYVANGGKTGTTTMSSSGENDLYWLRTPGKDANKAVYINQYGAIKTEGTGLYEQNIAVRPAFNLNTSSVLFTSLAEGGKNQSLGLEEVVTHQYTTSQNYPQYKMTLLDASRHEFEAEILKTSTKTAISYSGATTGQNEYISAIIKDENGNATYYGRLKNISNATDSSGIIDYDFSDKVNPTDTLYIFNEQYNGDYMTDYSSDLREVTEPNTVNAYNIVFETNNGTINGDYSSTYIVGRTTKLPTNVTKNDCIFAGWYDNSSFSGNAITKIGASETGNKRYYAKWFNYNELTQQLNQMLTELNSVIESNNTDISNLYRKINNINYILSTLGNTYATNADVQAKITEAQNAAVNAAKQLIDAAKTELNEAISQKADTETVNTAIENLQNAIDSLEAIKDNYVTADAELKTELEGKISSAQATLKAALDSLSDELSNVKNELNSLKNELESKSNELTKKDSELLTFTIIVCVISCVALVGGAFAIWFFIFGNKKR